MFLTAIVYLFWSVVMLGGFFGTVVTDVAPTMPPILKIGICMLGGALFNQEFHRRAGRSERGQTLVIQCVCTLVGQYILVEKLLIHPFVAFGVAYSVALLTDRVWGEISQRTKGELIHLVAYPVFFGLSSIGAIRVYPESWMYLVTGIAIAGLLNLKLKRWTAFGIHTGAQIIGWLLFNQEPVQAGAMSALLFILAQLLQVGLEERAANKQPVRGGAY